MIVNSENICPECGEWKSRRAKRCSMCNANRQAERSSKPKREKEWMSKTCPVCGGEMSRGAKHSCSKCHVQHHLTSLNKECPKCGKPTKVYRNLCAACTKESRDAKLARFGSPSRRK